VRLWLAIRRLLCKHRSYRDAVHRVAPGLFTVQCYRCGAELVGKQTDELGTFWDDRPKEKAK
jgi:hypothetical protein